MQQAITINDVYIPHLKNYARTQIYYGGSSSGKSWFLAQRCVLDVLSGGRNYLVCRQVARTIRSSVFQQVERVIREAELLPYFNVNKSDAVITCRNGYQIIFAGLDDTEKIKSIVPAVGVITDIWVEESTETGSRSVKDLYKRQRGGDEQIQKRMILSFNPIMKTHWIYDEHFKNIAWADNQTQYTSDGLSILKTTYLDNRFLTEQDRYDLENERDKYYRDVYTLGNWGVLGNVIFTNWEVRDLSDMRNQFTNPRNGLDFGFSSHPAAVIQTHYDSKNKTIYIYNELYSTGLTNDLLAAEVIRMIGSEYVVCDSAEPKSIVELQQHKVTAVAAKKGKDSVNFGIDWLMQQNIVVDSQCINTRNELQSYKWKEDGNGNAMRVPVDANNHIMDALRYAYEYDMIEQWTSF